MSQELEEVERRIADQQDSIANAKAQLNSIQRELELGAPMPNSLKQARLVAKANAVAKVKEELDALGSLELRKRQLLDHERSVAAAKAEAVERVHAEERAFWIRRFHTSLAIAHGAALAAIASKLLDKDVDPVTVKYALGPMGTFALGLVIAGALPFLLSIALERLARILAGVAAGLLIAALAWTLVLLNGVADRQIDARVHAKPHAPPAPSGPPEIK